MQEYKGVITGIGDKLEGANLIQPQLDAYWRDFVVGGNAILGGLDLERKTTEQQYSQSVSGTASYTPQQLTGVSATIVDYTYLQLKNESSNVVAYDGELHGTSGELIFTFQGVINPKDTVRINTGTPTFHYCIKFSYTYYGTVIVGRSNNVSPTSYQTNLTVNTKATGTLQLNPNLFDVKNVVGGTYNSATNTIAWETNGVSTIYVINDSTVTYGSLSTTISYVASSLTADSLTSGACLACGYVGYFPNTIPTNANLIYGRFVIKHSNGPDEFYIMTSDTEVNHQDDILNEPGEYWLLLYKDGILNSNLLHYPAKSVHSDKSDVLLEGGTISADCVAVTQKVDDNSDRVATTQYVANQIEKDINYAKTNLVYVIGTRGQNLGTYNAATIYLERKAKKVYAKIVWNTGSMVELNTLISYTIQPLPTGFIPIEDVTFSLPRTQSVITGYPDSFLIQYKISAGSNQAVQQREIDFNLSNDERSAIFDVPVEFFYETNE